MSAPDNTEHRTDLSGWLWAFAFLGLVGLWQPWIWGAVFGFGAFISAWWFFSKIFGFDGPLA